MPGSALAVSLLFTVLLIASGIADSGRDQLQGWGTPLFAGALLLMTAAQCARRRYPIAAYLVTVAVTCALVVTVGDLGFTPLYWCSIVLLAIRVSGARLVATIAVGIAGDILASSTTASGWIVPTMNIVISYTVLLALGKVIAHNRSQAELNTAELRQHTARLEEAVENERRTMARELHDVAAHHLTAMIVQARSADMLIDHDPAKSQELMRDVVASGQRTLDGLRQIVGILRYSSDEATPPQPMVGDIADLVEQSAHSLRSVTTDITDDVESVDSAVQLACFRIVQESLSNAMRHAPGSRVHIELCRRNGMVHLTVSDTGHDGPAARDGQGLGLAGMRERAVLLGGNLEAGPNDDGGWCVTARMPVDGRIVP
ncbi:sensor histidine kinase [Rhodococcoides trifolii]|uniref:sensor histidine kinase n=1 Tax=Rhodococcoides trifolii TaxID=908250 RepID=UPI0016649FA0|nr:sensor histidine kinase [Rhodococcus trifolii]